ncbi:MAG TPA: DUF3579 domain-containing protein [Gammaproteobacteria bacterium]
MPFDTRYIYIEGESSSKIRVRPHNWAERFAGNMATYGRDLRFRYADVLEPVMVNGIKCLRVCPSLETSQPVLFREVLEFAGHYDLRVHGLTVEPELAQAS